MNNTNSTRGFTSTRMTPPQQTAHELTTNMDTPTEKHQGSSVAFDTSSNLLHVRASGHKTHPEHLYTEHDAYVQDLHQQQDAGGMKGNRLTTIATIWHTHATATLSNNFVLLLGHELVKFKDVCEELDYFNDKFVCLRAVGKDLKQAKGKELGEGCPQEVIEIE
ncbi:hypothetical protein LTR56_027535 [Elasticomyces elasticus]|nr:hypothetical protein LTR56_027535 [Elasticomyces elasticus]KAK5746737.1 hypothetical protein LTS12_022634 [Elasticomyces elasticus]